MGCRSTPGRKVKTMNLTTGELARINACQTAQEWQAICDAVKAARKGAYPPDWFPVVLQSGLCDRVVKRWGGSAEIKVTTISTKGGGR